MAEPPLHQVGTARAGPRPCVCGGLMPPLRLVFWLRGSSSEIGFLRIFSEFLLKVGFLHKNETPEQFCRKQH
jgi:hypothetical protein